MSELKTFLIDVEGAEGTLLATDMAAALQKSRKLFPGKEIIAREQSPIEPSRLSAIEALESYWHIRRAGLIPDLGPAPSRPEIVVRLRELEVYRDRYPGGGVGAVWMSILKHADCGISKVVWADYERVVRAWYGDRKIGRRAAEFRARLENRIVDRGDWVVAAWSMSLSTWVVVCREHTRARATQFCGLRQRERVAELRKRPLSDLPYLTEQLDIERDFSRFLDRLPWPARLVGSGNR